MMNILKEDHLSSLPEDLILKARYMSKVYEYMYCIENLLRLYLDKHVGKSQFKIPNNVSKGIEVRKQDEMKHKWFSLRGNSDLFYMDFKDISGLINFNWELFKEDFPSQSWITAKLEDLARYRNLIAHNSYIEKSDLDTVKVHFNTISRQLNIRPKTSFLHETNADSLFVKGLNNSKLYTPMEMLSGIHHSLVYPPEINVAPIALETYFNKIGPFFQIKFENTAVNIYPETLLEEDSGYQESDEKYKYRQFQIGQFDIDNDGMEELFICEQNNDPDCVDDQIMVNIFKYYPPAFISHANRSENWEIMGSFDCSCIMGDPIAYVENNSVCIPRNFNGYYFEWVYVRGEFIERGM